MALKIVAYIFLFLMFFCELEGVPSSLGTAEGTT